MRTHLLKELPIHGREKILALEPEFDFYEANNVRKLVIDFGGEAGNLPSLTLELLYNGRVHRHAVVVLFEGVRQLTLPKMAPSLFISELEIEDIKDRMMEGIHFEAISYFDHAFRCACKSISILSFELV